MSDLRVGQQVQERVHAIELIETNVAHRLFAHGALQQCTEILTSDLLYMAHSDVGAGPVKCAQQGLMLRAHRDTEQVAPGTCCGVTDCGVGTG